ncbi:DNA polymerase II [Vibrio sp.]|nr:DNA polymerase II [Vibrio sp.]
MGKGILAERNQGFVLTRQVKEFRNQIVIELWVNTSQGAVLLEIPDEKSVFFIQQQDKERVHQLAKALKISTRYSDTVFHTFEHQTVIACYLSSFHLQRQLCRQLEHEHIEHFEADIKVADRYLMERFIHGGIEFIGTPKPHSSYPILQNSKTKKADFTPNLTTVSLDIECSEKGILYSVGLTHPKDNRVIMVGKPQDTSEDVSIQWVPTEKSLLQALLTWFEYYDPDVIIGWSVINFDFKLLVKRAEYHALPLNLGRGKKPIRFRQSNQSNQCFITIPGRVVIDGIDALKTATYHFRSWSLESVSNELLGEGKIIHNVHDRMDEINHMYRTNKPALAKYNLQDCLLVQKIFDKTNLLSFLIERTKLTGIELDRVGGSVAAFTNLYLPQIHRAGYVAPNLYPENWIASPGGYVMDSIPGLYDSVLVLDFKSLYPSIIRSFLIDPMGLIEGLKQKIGLSDDDAIEGFRGAQFHRNKHFLPKMIENLWEARDRAKANNEAAFSQAIKIIMNSFYGVLGSSGCRFFDTRLASSITMRGHEILNDTKVLIEELGYQVIYGDTDSVFVYLGEKKSQKKADSIGKELVVHINQAWKDRLQKHHNLPCFLELEYETHYTKFLMPTIRGTEAGSKKRYAGITHKNGKENLIFKGLETVRTDWTPLAQEFQQTLYDMVFHDIPCDDYIIDMTEKTKSGAFDNKLTYQKRLRRNLAEYQKNIPPQVKAARLADEFNQRLGRPLQYQNKGTIEYVITLYGPEPKEYQQNPIDYDHYVDKQLKPIADAILPFIGKNFDDITAPQMGLF